MLIGVLRVVAATVAIGDRSAKKRRSRLADDLEAAETHTAQARGCQPRLKKRRFSGLECFFGWFSAFLPTWCETLRSARLLALAAQCSARVTAARDVARRPRRSARPGEDMSAAAAAAAAGVPPGVHSVWVINKSGGLVYQKNYADVPGIDTNETLRLASIWHSLHAISAQLSPVEGCTGIELLETEHFDLRCIQTATGTKFFVTASPRTIGLDQLLRTVYDLYGDYVMKNPFYELEMPIRCELFDQNLAYAVRALNNAFGY
jgi:hypothetical protein